MMLQRIIPKQCSKVSRSKCYSVIVPESWSQFGMSSSWRSNRTATTMTMSFSTVPLTDQEQQFHKEGIVDERGLVQFDTLHNMQVRSCRVFANKNLFARKMSENTYVVSIC